MFRGAAIGGALWFFAFCAVWSGLAVVLSQSPYLHSAERIGLYALAGVSGVLATRLAGAWTDRAGAAYMLVHFIGGSLGTAFGAATADLLGWPITAAAIGAAAMQTAVSRPRR